MKKSDEIKYLKVKRDQALWWAVFFACFAFLITLLWIWER